MNEKQLKEMLNKEPVELLWDKIKDLQQRINKAIHLINHNDIMHYSVFEKELLKILKGEI